MAGAASLRESRSVEHLLEPRQFRVQCAQQFGELHEPADRLEETPGQHVERHEAAQRHLGVDHLPAANPEHCRTGKRGEQDRDGFRDVTEFLEPLPGVQLACLMAAPTGEEIVLGRSRAQSFDVAQSGEADADPQTLFAMQTMTFVGPEAAGETRRGGARRRDEDHHSRESRIVNDHQRQEGKTHRQI